MRKRKPSLSPLLITDRELVELQLEHGAQTGVDFLNNILRKMNTLVHSRIDLIVVCDQEECTPTIVAISLEGDAQNSVDSIILAICQHLKNRQDSVFQFTKNQLGATIQPLETADYIGASFSLKEHNAYGFILSVFDDQCQQPTAVLRVHEILLPRIAAETARIVHEKKLTNELQQFRFALNTINLGVYEWNTTKDISVFNKHLFDIIEYQEGDFETTFKNWVSIVHPEDYDKLAVIIEQNREHEQTVYPPVRYRIRTKSGNYKWVEVQSYSYTDKTDNTRHNIGTIKDIDQQLKAEQKLNEIQQREFQLHQQISQREKLYAFALKAGNLGVYNWYVKEGRAVMSQKLAEILGREEKDFEISFSDWLSLVHPDDQWQFNWKNYHQQAIHNPHTLHIYRIKNRQNEYRWIETQNMVAETDETGLITRMVGIVRDLNEEKKFNDELLRSFEKQRELHERLKTQAEKLVESESRWAYALEGHGDGVVEWNIQTGECVFSTRAQKILGFPLNTRDAINKFIEHVHPDHQQEFSGYFQLSLKPPFEPFQIDVQILDDSNNYNWVMFRGKVVEFTATGEPLRMVGTVSYVSAQKIFQKEFTIYEEMIKQNQSAILFLSMSGTIEFVNNTTTTWLGYRKYEILEKHISFLLVNNNAEKLLAENYRGVEQLITQSGSYLMAQVATSMLRLEGETIGYVLNLIDITEKKQLEEELTLLKVAKLEAELQHQRKQTEIIIQAQENEKGSIARELHDGIGQLLSLAKLQLAQLSLNPHDPEKFHGLEELIQQITSDVKGLTSELMPLSLRKLGLESAVRSLLEHYNRLIGQDINITCKINLNDYEPDPTIAIHIYHITQEALNNMMKYSRATKISVMMMKLKNSINLIIEDNGRGFDVQEKLKKQNSYGLKTMNERAKLIHAKLRINSATKTGTTISLTVPLVNE